MEGHRPHTLEYFPVYLSSSDSFIHYTCNAPSGNILAKHGIKSRGDEFGCKDPREVLEIPSNIYKKAGFMHSKDNDVLNINLESLMKNLK